MQSFARSIVETVRHPLVVLDEKLREVVANTSLYRNFCFEKSATEGHSRLEIASVRWDLPRLRSLLLEVIPRDASFKEFEVEYYCARLGRRVMVLDAHRVARDEDGVPMVLLAIEDDTERRRVRNVLRQMNTALGGQVTDRLVLNESPPRG